jgi:hypothetical protein
MTMLKPGKINKIAEQMLILKYRSDHCTVRNMVERTLTNKEK